MASHPPGKCCYRGVVHEGEAKGQISRLGDIETYVSYPEDKSTEYGILLLTDVIGHSFINAQLIADQFAANGYVVLMPDLFAGDAIPLNRPGDFDLQKWFTGAYATGTKRPHTPPSVDPIVDACLIEMRTKLNCKKIGAVGYCFGAKYVVRHLRPDEGKIDVGYCAHPSFIDKEELQDMKGPLAISAAETDSIFPTEKRHETEVILKEMKASYQINLYAGVEHGFAVRGDMKDQKQKYAKENAFLQALEWFEEYLK